MYGKDLVKCEIGILFGAAPQNNVDSMNGRVRYQQGNET